VIGAIDAYRAEASTTLLIVGAVLLLFGAIIVHDWSEIELSHGASEARVLRRVDQVLERVEEEQPELREQVAELRAELDEYRRSERTLAPLPTWPLVLPPTSRASVSPLTLPPLPPQPSHTFGDGSVTLSLRVGLAGQSHAYTCGVYAPNGGKPWTRRIDPPLLKGVLPFWAYSCVFPDEFMGSGPLEPGNYLVEWRGGSSGPALAVSGAPQLSALIGALVGFDSLPIVATDSFTIGEPPT
jgi:hypothetical protein